MLKLELPNFSSDIVSVKSVTIDNLFKIEDKYGEELQLKLMLYVKEGGCDNTSIAFNLMEASEWKLKKTYWYDKAEVIKEKLKEFKVLSDKYNDTYICLDFKTPKWFPSFNIIELITNGETEIEFGRKSMNSVNALNIFIKGEGFAIPNILNPFETNFYELSVHFAYYNKCKLSLVNSDNLSKGSRGESLVIEEILERVKNIFKRNI